VFGPPRDRDTALAVLHEAVASGVNHIASRRSPDGSRRGRRE
jgi:hypothetical protein